MNKPLSKLQFMWICSAVLLLIFVVIKTYPRSSNQATGFTETTQSTASNAHLLNASVYRLQLSFSETYFSHPSTTKQDTLDAFYDTWSIINKLQTSETSNGSIIATLAKVAAAMTQLEPHIRSLGANNGSLEFVEHSLKNDIRPSILSIINTAEQASSPQNLNTLSPTVIWLAMFAIIAVIVTLISLLISQISNTRKALIKAEQAKVAKAKFLSIAGHDLRQPLQASNLLLSSLRTKSETPENSPLFKDLNRALDSITELLNGMLDISKLDADMLTVTKEPVAIGPLIDKVCERFEEQAQKKGLLLSVINPHDVFVESDELQLERIISSLLSNAIQYTQKGGVRVIVSTTSDNIKIQLEDTGYGIAKEDQEEIFQELVQLDKSDRLSTKGLGLGLSIARKLSELLGHTLSMESYTGQGSKFSLDLKRCQAPAPANTLTKVREQWTLEGTTIFIVEDDTSILSSLEALLKTWGCHVIATENMQQAIKQANQLKKLPSKDFLIISDYYLNDVCNGCEVISRIKKILCADLPAIVITGETNPDRLKEIRTSGNNVFRKPIKPAQLRVAIQRLLRQ